MLHCAWVYPGIPLSPTELKSQQKVREKGQHVMIFHSKVEICIAVSCRFSLLLLSFLPPVRTPASQGPTSPSSAPPRCQNNLATLPHHTHTRCVVGSSPRHPVARPNRDLCFLDENNEHRPVSTTGVAPRDQRTLWST